LPYRNNLSLSITITVARGVSGIHEEEDGTEAEEVVVPLGVTHLYFIELPPRAHCGKSSIFLCVN
jgi:hypothetical protein